MRCLFADSGVYMHAPSGDTTVESLLSLGSAMNPAAVTCQAATFSRNYSFLAQNPSFLAHNRNQNASSLDQFWSYQAYPSILCNQVVVPMGMAHTASYSTSTLYSTSSLSPSSPPSFSALDLSAVDLTGSASGSDSTVSFDGRKKKPSVKRSLTTV